MSTNDELFVLYCAVKGPTRIDSSGKIVTISIREEIIDSYHTAKHGAKDIRKEAIQRIVDGLPDEFLEEAKVAYSPLIHTFEFGEEPSLKTYTRNGVTEAVVSSSERSLRATHADRTIAINEACLAHSRDVLEQSVSFGVTKVGGGWLVSEHWGKSEAFVYACPLPEAMERAGKSVEEKIMLKLVG